MRTIIILASLLLWTVIVTAIGAPLLPAVVESVSADPVQTYPALVIWDPVAGATGFRMVCSNAATNVTSMLNVCTGAVVVARGTNRIEVYATNRFGSSSPGRLVVNVEPQLIITPTIQSATNWSGPWTNASGSLTNTVGVRFFKVSLDRQSSWSYRTITNAP